MEKFKKTQLVLVDNELFIILKILKNNKYKIQNFLNKDLIYTVDEFYISSY